MPRPSERNDRDDRGRGGRGMGGPRRRRSCRLCAEKIDYVDFKDVKMLQSFVPERGKIMPAKNLRRLRASSTEADRGNQASSQHRIAALHGRLRP